METGVGGWGGVWWWCWEEGLRERGKGGERVALPQMELDGEQKGERQVENKLRTERGSEVRGWGGRVSNYGDGKLKLQSVCRKKIKLCMVPRWKEKHRLKPQLSPHLLHQKYTGTILILITSHFYNYFKTLSQAWMWKHTHPNMNPNIYINRKIFSSLPSLVLPQKYDFSRAETDTLVQVSG